ncbi:MAG: hypothetical protein WA081_14545 [Desulfosalsimonadaceae bacterium]
MFKNVNVKDAFTRMSQEREREKRERTLAKEKEIAAKQQRAQQIEKVKINLYALLNEAAMRRKKIKNSV